MLQFSYPGPDLRVSLHNHSCWSDGSAELEEVCRKGKEAGIKVLGLSDHYVAAPGKGYGSEVWSMELSRLDSYRKTLLKLREQLEDDSFSLKIGLEVDFFFENADCLLPKLAALPLDYLIGSVHYADTFPIDHSILDWQNLTEEEKEKICEKYYEKLEAAALRKEFSFLGHLDLPKKFGLIENDRYFPHAVRVLDNAAKTGMGIELNTAGWHKECNEQYPSLPILREAAKRRIPVIVNADAHDPAHLQRDFLHASEILLEAGYPKRSF